MFDDGAGLSELRCKVRDDRIGGWRPPNVRGRKQCLDCLPHRPLRQPRRPVHRAIVDKVCEACGAPFAKRQVIGDRLRFLYRRRFCLNCSPFGTHNTSKRPPGIDQPEELREFRRRRKHRRRHAELDASGGHATVEHRRRRKLRAIEYMGRTCQACARDGVPAIFEFHHRDAAEKSFGISHTGIPHKWETVIAELAKCVMLCANCHREVHAGVRELFDDGLLGLAEEATAYRCEVRAAA